MSTLTKKHIRDLAGMLNDARCRAFKDEFMSADAVISFFEDKIINFILDDVDPLSFDISKFQDASRIDIKQELERQRVYEQEPESGTETTNYDNWKIRKCNQSKP